MATPLTKPIRRVVVIGDRAWVVSLLPPDAAARFPQIEFRPKGRRYRYTVPLESARNHAAQRHREWEKREKKRLKEERRKLRESGEL